MTTTRPVHQDLDAALAAANAEGGFDFSVVSTQHGLTVSSAGASPQDVETLAALTSIFDIVVERASRDAGLEEIDEVTLKNGGHGRLVVRRLADADGVRLFLVSSVPAHRTWRRVTNTLVRDIDRVLARRGAA